MKRPKAGPRILFCVSTLLLGWEVAFYDTEGRAAEVRSGWQREWETTVEAAKREGELGLYVGAPWDAIMQSGIFQKAYPQIKVNTVAGRGGQIAQRIMAERRAGKYLADVVIEGLTATYTVFYQAKMLDPLKPALVLPEVVDESKWWQGRHAYLDPERQYVFKYTGIPLTLAYYNSNLANPRDFKSLWDFLNPKWKGKIESRDARVPGHGGGTLRFFYYHPELGPKFIRRLYGETDVTLFRDYRQGVDWLASGKFAICLFCSDIEKAKAQGLPVDTFPMVWKEGTGLVSQYGTVSLMSKAPHPQAARVFVNWFLSREGQLNLQRTLAKAEGSAPDSLRIDISKGDIDPAHRRTEGVKYLDVDVPGQIDMSPVYRVMEEALAEADKRKRSR